jgi:hypothetical protein
MIADGFKTHTLRSESRQPRTVGGICHCYTGLRTPQCELIGRWPCSRIDRAEIFIDPERGFSVAINEALLRWDELISLAYADGFRFAGRGSKEQGDVLAMKAFWIRENGLGKRISRWTGQMIHWDFKR